MEQLQGPEKQPTHTIKNMLREQLEIDWLKADQELKTVTEQLEARRDVARAKLELFEHTLGTPVLVVTIDTWTTVYDIYTCHEASGSRISNDYQIQTDNIDDVLQAVEELIKNNETLLRHLQQNDLGIRAIGMPLMNGDLLFLDRAHYDEAWNGRERSLRKE